MSSIIMLEAGQKLPSAKGTEVLAEYPSGEKLIRTNAPQIESGSNATDHGLTLDGITPEMISNAESLPMSETGDDADYLSYVVFAGPIHSGWLKEIRKLSVKPLRFQPQSAYLCRATQTAFDKAKKLAFVTSVVPFIKEFKPSFVMSESGNEQVWVIVEGSADVESVVAQLQQISGFEIDGDLDRGKVQVRIPAQLNGDASQSVLQHPMVLSIEQRIAITPEDEIADLILCGSYDHSGEPVGSYLRWLEDHGINGRDVTIGIVDSGVDETHDAFSERITSKDNGRSWHGTFVAGHAAGNYLAERDADNFIYGLGMAPASGLISQNNQNASADLCDETVTTSAPNGARGSIQNNSWGVAEDNELMDYRSREAAYDEYVRDASKSTSSALPLTVCFSAGNKGESGLTRPKAAKNVLVTGNSENLRDVGGSDSDNINEVYSGSHASSRGNCGDGRIRPHIVAPGEWTASANFDSHPGDSEYISAQLTWGGGTSGASPKSAGACALLTQWWKDRNAGELPSPALLRAMIVNGAEDMNYRGPIPNPYQGWGRLNLANVLSENVHHLYADQSTLLRHRGEERFWRIKVSDSSMPLRVTLAWTDPPGGMNTGTSDISAIVNYLGLRVNVDEQIYYGNNFSQGWSSEGELPNPDREGWDNLQNVYIRADHSAEEIMVRVRALNITTNCLNGTADRPQQDFALVITNGYLDAGSSPTDMFLVIDDTSPGSGSSVDDDQHWTPGSGGDSEDDMQWWMDVDSQDRPTLRRGSDGHHVEVLQRLLSQLNFLDGAIDGDFGSGTHAAVIDFQRAEGLQTDGIVGSGTWSALYAAVDSAALDLGDADDSDDHQNSPVDSSNMWWNTVAASDRPVLRRGDDSEDVRILQQLLSELGYLDSAIDGDFGRRTLTAVKNFQRDMNLGADGIVGSGTWTVLYDVADTELGGSRQPDPASGDDVFNPGNTPGSIPNLPTLRRGDRGEDVETLQRLLFIAGYLGSSQPDGIFGSGTESGVKAFQRDSGLIADGICGAVTWTELFNVTGETSPQTPAETPSNNSTDDDSWWGNDWDEDWNDDWAVEASALATVESTQSVPNSTIALAALEGFTATSQSEHADSLMVPVGSSQSTESGVSSNGSADFMSMTTENDRSNSKIAQAITENSMPDLEESLQRLMARWENLGDQQSTGQARRIAGIVVVGANTKVSNWSLSALRRIAIHGELTIISTDESTLQFLVQRLHMVHGISFRRATAGNVDECVRSVAKKSSGAQCVVLREDRFTDRGGSEVTRVGFRVNEFDKRIILEINSPDELVIAVKPPAHDALNLTARGRRDWIRLTRSEKAQRIEITRRDNDPWEGTWDVRLESSKPISVNAWAWSNLNFSVKHKLVQNHDGAQETDREQSRISISASSDYALQQVSVNPRGPAGVAAEQSRRIRAVVQPSRLDSFNNRIESSGIERDEMPLAATIDVNIPMATTESSKMPQTMDLEIEVRGETSSGHRFERCIDSCKTQLVPRSEWRRARAKKKQMHTNGFVSGVLQEVHESPDGTIQRVRIALDEHEDRLLRVQDPQVRNQLATLRTEVMPLHWRLTGNQVMSVRTAAPQSEGV